MAKKRDDDSQHQPRERAYTGPTCWAHTATGQRCGQPAYQGVDGQPMCDSHAEQARARQADEAEVQAEARDWCLRRGLDTPAKVRAEAARLARRMFAEPGNEWAKRVLMRDANGEQIPSYAVGLAAKVAPDGY